MNYCLLFLVGIIAGILANVLSDTLELNAIKLKNVLHYVIRDKYCVIVNIIMPLLFLYISVKMGINFDSIKTMVFVTLLAVAVLHDIKRREIPNKLIIAFLIIGMVFAVLSLNINVLLNSIMSFLLFGVAFLIISKVSKGGVGEGDIKLIACSGLFLGVSGLFASVFMAMILVFVASIALIILRLVNRKSFLPFAPFLLAGFLISIF